MIYAIIIDCDHFVVAVKTHYVNASGIWSYAGIAPSCESQVVLIQDCVAMGELETTKR